MSTVIDEIVALFERKGRVAYLGEGVSMAEHMLQTARAAECDGAPPPLVVAALLHDIGHLVHGMDDDSADHGIDTAHEVAGARWLERAFGPDVTEPIRLHVAAKRYLCATEPEYLAVLSPASVHTMALQGGPFTPDEAAAFATTPGADDAVRVRRWDDAGKVVGGTTPPLDHYLPLLAACRRPWPSPPGTQPGASGPDEFLDRTSPASRDDRCPDAVDWLTSWGAWVSPRRGGRR